MSEASVPPPRTPGRYRIAVVCLGNICRSPMADVVLNARMAATGIDELVEVVSAGTAGWHTGKPMDERAAALLTAEGYDASSHRAQQVQASWLDELDLVLTMDRANLSDVRSLTSGEVDPHRVRPFRDFDPVDPGGEVPDPYYGGADGFRDVLTMVERTSTALAQAVRRALGD